MPTRDREKNPIRQHSPPCDFLGHVRLAEIVAHAPVILSDSDTADDSHFTVPVKECLVFCKSDQLFTESSVLRLSTF